MKTYKIIAKRNMATFEQIVSEKELTAALKKLKQADFTIVSFDSIDEVGPCDSF